MKKIVLASASPRRIEMMHKNGIDPVVMPAHIQESPPLYGGMENTTMFLALKKAMFVYDKHLPKIAPGSVIVAADTVVYDEDVIGKPETPEEATATLLSLSGKSHRVCTGVALIDRDNGTSRCFCEISTVLLKHFTDEDISEYVNTPEPYDKAGGYAIQGTFKKFIDCYEGDLDNIIGFPWKRFTEELELLTQA